ncbi:hypothetical protein HN011_000512 [Eciton burchellii]|nr:hypothetical protein HN011_000512 [Eciton burchellii]
MRRSASLDEPVTVNRYVQATRYTRNPSRYSKEQTPATRNAQTEYEPHLSQNVAHSSTHGLDVLTINDNKLRSVIIETNDCDNGYANSIVSSRRWQVANRERSINITEADQRSTRNPKNSENSRRNRKHKKKTRKREINREIDHDPAEANTEERFCGSCCSKQLFHWCMICFRWMIPKPKEPKVVPEEPEVPPEPVKKRELERIKRREEREKKKVEKEERRKRKEIERAEKRAEMHKEVDEERLVPEKPPEKLPEKPPEKRPEKPPEKRPEKPPEKPPEKRPEKPPEKPPEKLPEKLPERLISVDPTKTCCYLCVQNTMAIMAASGKLPREQNDKSVQALTIRAPVVSPETRPCRSLMLRHTIQASMRVRMRDASVMCMDESPKEKKVRRNMILSRLTKTRCPARPYGPCNMNRIPVRCDNCVKERNPGPKTKRNEKNV